MYAFHTCIQVTGYAVNSVLGGLSRSQLLLKSSFYIHFSTSPSCIHHTCADVNKDMAVSYIVLHTASSETHTAVHVHELRRELDGMIHPDPVTGKPSLYYPDCKWYIFSFLATLPLLSPGVVAMTLTLNFNGYVTSKESPMYVRKLASFAQLARHDAIQC